MTGGRPRKIRNGTVIEDPLPTITLIKPAKSPTKNIKIKLYISILLR